MRLTPKYLVDNHLPREKRTALLFECLCADYLVRYQSRECSNVTGYKIGDDFFVAFVEICLALSVTTETSCDCFYFKLLQIYC